MNSAAIVPVLADQIGDPMPLIKELLQFLLKVGLALGATFFLLFLVGLGLCAGIIFFTRRLIKWIRTSRQPLEPPELPEAELANRSKGT
jgi:UPF0716 family protein affecting phage T7 exclusion